MIRNQIKISSRKIGKRRTLNSLGWMIKRMIKFWLTIIKVMIILKMLTKQNNRTLWRITCKFPQILIKWCLKTWMRRWNSKVELTRCLMTKTLSTIVQKMNKITKMENHFLGCKGWKIFNLSFSGKLIQLRKSLKLKYWRNSSICIPTKMLSLMNSLHSSVICSQVYWIQ